MTPDSFSIRGPHGTVPWVAIVDPSLEDFVAELVWARTRQEAEGYINARNRGALEIRLFRVTNPNHHLGVARVVPLTELA